MDPIKVDFGSRGKNRKKEIIIPPEKAVLKIIISVVGTLLLSALYYYLMLPPINLKAPEFYMFIAAVFAIYIVLTGLTTKAMAKPEYIPYLKKHSIIPVIAILLVGIVVGLGFAVSSVFFRAKKYSEIMPVNENGVFSTEIEKQDAKTYSNIPRLDEPAAANLANRALSTLSNLGKVSQFTVYPEYPQINYKGEPVRVATLDYANIIKWFTNRKEGFPGYIVINMATQKTEFEEFKEPMMYSPAEHLGRLLKRKLRFDYPTYIFGNPVFELDEDSNAFWICPVMDKTIGMFGGVDVKGMVLLNPNNGTSVYYDLETVKNADDLRWIDRLYSSELLIQQYNYHGKYNGGFWNSILGQKNVYMTTEGNSIIAKDDDVYLYTGVTSVTSDKSIIGFILINQRTKAATYYRVAGAMESTAMETAQGMVQDLGYTAAFPLLINVGDQPTYFMALKDSEQVNQRFAMIDVEKYNTIKVVGDSLTDCLEQYLKALTAAGMNVEFNVDDIQEGGESGEVKPDEVKTVTGTVAEIRTAVMGGESWYFIKLAGGDVYYSVSASKAKDAIILNNGQNVTVTFAAVESSGRIIEVDSLKLEVQ